MKEEPKIIEKFRAVVTGIADETAIVTLFDENGEEKGIIDMPKKDFVDQNILFEKSVVFDLIVHQVGKNEELIMTPFLHEFFK